MKMNSILNIKPPAVHCSDKEDDKDLYAIDFHKIHLKFGWDVIVYHKVICISGEIENGSPEYWKEPHVKGKNEVSLGVYLIGSNELTQKNVQILMFQIGIKN